MKKSDGLSIISHLVNFAIVIYFTTFLLSKNMLTLTDSSINFFGLFVSLVANIYAIFERYKGE